MTPRRKHGTALEPYRRKRSAGATPEPFSTGAARPGLFVVQKHAARRMHYDLRLELDGVLLSWAVPKGPSLDPTEKRLAVHVEDHPLEYAEFEGTIPDGNYGAGAVIVWDRGRWEPVEDPREGLEHGKLLFDLHGYKLRGRFTLFRTGKDPAGKDWLLMKKPDAEAAPGKDSFVEASVRSGLTVEQLRDGFDPAGEILRTLERSGAPRRRFDFARLEPMLGKVVDRAFSDPAWWFEIKVDGYRMLASRDGGRVTLRYRSGRDATAVFPEIASALAALPFSHLVVDGEVAVCADGRPSFQSLQQRVHLTRRQEVSRAAVEHPATLFLFDLLAFEEHDLRALPLSARKPLLRAVVPAAGPLRFCEAIEERGEDVYAAVCELGLEGVMAKRADSPYVSGRSDAWRKIRADRTTELAIVGFTAPKRGRPGFGALHLAFHENGAFVYAGRVGTGFDDTLLNDLAARLSTAVRNEPPCGAPLPPGREHTWVEPQLVAEVRHKEWTEQGLLRQPVFLRLRDDLAPEHCARPGSVADPEPEPVALETPEGPAAAARVVPFTNLDKVFWPADGYTKGDLIEYYRTIAPHLMPYLDDRPVVLTRYPDGIRGKSFFQKDAPGFVPDWIRTERMWSEHAERDVHYFVVDSVEALLYLANLGTIPLHLWASRVSSLQRPDWCILDLDPKDAPFDHVVRIARHVRRLALDIGLEPFVKTSGSTGLHVLLPLGAACTYDECRTFGELLARTVVDELPDVATVARSPARRDGKVYVDYLQNGHGKLLVAPYSVRPLDGAPVSAPLDWSEVKRGLDIRAFTIRTLPERLRGRKRDPLAPVLDAQPDLPAVLERLADRLR
jgi:bifunctional non-homologous end joining protein LigD